MTIELEQVQRFRQWMDNRLNFGRGFACYMESMFTPGRARLPRKLKKAVKKYMRMQNKNSMVIEPQNQFVCFKKDGRLIVCHARY